MRAVSLLPAATEIVAALGLLDRLQGVSHECGFPPEAARIPRVTVSPLAGTDLSSAAVDARVREALATEGTLYRLDEGRMRAAAPDVIFTQALCDVCAADYGSVKEFALRLPGPPRVVSLDPSSLEEAWGDVVAVAEALGERERGEALARTLRARVAAVRAATAGAARPRVFVMEWLDPVYATGHWGPELVEAAGGVEVLGRAGADSVRVEWEAVVAAAPEVIVVAACGWTAERALREMDGVRARPGWGSIPAVRAGRVFAADGNAFFSRPGPRLADTVEILGHLLHPDRVAAPTGGGGAVRAG